MKNSTIALTLVLLACSACASSTRITVGDMIESLAEDVEVCQSQIDALVKKGLTPPKHLYDCANGKRAEAKALLTGVKGCR